VVPYLFQHMFSSWFAGIAFSAIIIGALVPAAIMAIAAASAPPEPPETDLFTERIVSVIQNRSVSTGRMARASGRCT
jgi:Na+/proline symporter